MNFSGWIEPVRRLSVVALLLLAGWLLVRIGWTAWDLATLEPPAPIASRSNTEAHNEAVEVPGSSLFGIPAIGEIDDGAPAVLRDGGLALRAVIASPDKAVAHAIIESGGISRAYFPGQSLQTGVTLQEVRPNEVLLLRNGRITRLLLSEMNLSEGSAAASGAGSLAGLDIPDTPPRMSLSQIVRMEPVMGAEGGMEGYQVFPRARRAQFEGLGLVSGDLVIAINGVPLDDATQAGQLINGSGDMMLSVMREGEQLEITVGSENFGLLAM